MNLFEKIKKIRNKNNKNKIKVKLNQILKSIDVDNDNLNKKIEIENYLMNLNYKNHNSLIDLSAFIEDLELQLIKFDLENINYELNDDLVNNIINIINEFWTYNFYNKDTILYRVINIIFLLTKYNKLNQKNSINLITYIFKIIDFKNINSLEKMLYLIYNCYEMNKNIKLIILKNIDNFIYNIELIFNESLNIRKFSLWIFNILLNDFKYLISNNFNDVINIINKFLEKIYNNNLEFINIKLIILSFTYLYEYNSNLIDNNILNNLILNSIEYIKINNNELIEVSLNFLNIYTHEKFNFNYFDYEFIIILITYLNKEEENFDENNKVYILYIINNLFIGFKKIFDIKLLNKIFDNIIINLNLFDSTKNLKKSCIYLLKNIFNLCKPKILADLIFMYNNIFIILINIIIKTEDNEIIIMILFIIQKSLKIGDLNSTNSNPVVDFLEDNGLLNLLYNLYENNKNEEVKDYIKGILQANE